MTPSKLVERVKAKDWELVEEDAGRIGPEAAPELVGLLDDEDEEVRELAVHCLNAAGGDEARKGLRKALRDSADDVRSAAARFVRAQSRAEDVPDLASELVSNEDEFVREQIALALGALGGPEARRALMARLKDEQDADTRHGISLALARLKNPEHRQAFLERLGAESPGARAKALRDYVYVQDRSLMPEIAPLLDDTREAVDVGPSHGPFWIRVCDVAIQSLDTVLDHPFSFPVDPARHFTPQERNEAKAVIAKVK